MEIIPKKDFGLAGSLYGAVEPRIYRAALRDREYIALLNEEGDASDKFWKLEKRIREDKKNCGVQCEMSRSNQFYIMLSLLNEGAIFMEDLEDFSDDLKEIMQHFAGL